MDVAWGLYFISPDGRGGHPLTVCQYTKDHLCSIIPRPIRWQGYDTLQMILVILRHRQRVSSSPAPVAGIQPQAGAHQVHQWPEPVCGIEQINQILVTSILWSSAKRSYLQQRKSYITNWVKDTLYIGYKQGIFYSVCYLCFVCCEQLLFADDHKLNLLLKHLVLEDKHFFKPSKMFLKMKKKEVMCDWQV